MNIGQALVALRRRWVVVVHDLAWVPACVFLAYWIRFNLEPIPATFFEGMLLTAAIALPLHAVTFWFFGCYRGIWRFASVPDFVRIAKAVALGGLGTALGVALFLRLQGIPRSVLVLYPVLLGLGVGTMRLGYRIIKDRHVKPVPTDLERALVLGAGRAGEALIRDLVRHGPFAPVALVDDDPRKQGNEIHGVRVSGTLDDLAELIPGLEVDVVLVAMANVPRAKLENIVRLCADAGALCRILPGLDQLANGQPNVSQMRPVTVEDLLGREPVRLDHRQVSRFLKGRRILVTGGGGSIGSELCRQLADKEPELLIIVDHSEYNLYRIEQELLARKQPVKFVKVLGDIRGPSIIETIFRRYSPQVVFHAAAYKHVPMVEDNPVEGVWNNVFGTRVVADAAVKYGASHFVFISTDKTVNPTSVMGATKRIAELYCQALGRQTDTHFITTRFGNVLGSTGSVVPHFEKQIKSGGPVTVTHEDVTRFFMTIAEAVSLILQAGAMGHGGEIFVLDMGQPVRIRDLAEKLIRLSGLAPGRDIEIAYTGLRPGEKMHEELFYKNEALRGTTHPKLLLASCGGTGWDVLETAMPALERAATAGDKAALIRAMQALVPQYRPGEAEMKNVAPGSTPLRVVK
ncbi:MAG TPA: nucleoside-diphosphate sugar epimerase/dehydratase [Gammaproteobacteria bacterium]|nr:nucleoside-diphosphate sugar epimerase/dehydratase [Gammaproteobacteria bacterium]HET7588339.1 nucleoside-diphosphate sugar epimerase/dehydratase [Gammaproteobacteria bacterium]